MSFQNYENFPQQGQPGDGGPGPGGPAQQDQNMGGQIPPNSAGGFQGGNGGDPGSAGGQSSGGDAKTTLWYDTLLLSNLGSNGLNNSMAPFPRTFHQAALLFGFHAARANGGTGWASLSLGSTRTSCEQFGTIWANKSM